MISDQQAEIDTLFEQLFADYQQPILNYLYRLVGDAARAEELAQETFVKAYRSLSRLPADANRRAWLYRIATNCGYDHLRRRRLVQWLPLMERDSTFAAQSDPAEAAGEEDAVRGALAQLSPGHRAVLILFSVQGYSTKEIAEVLEISPGAVKTRLCRAREKFRQLYGGRYDDGLEN
ncbi:MAG TPA: sigma-70 family RNA polymerase sigma factor [Anaerolineae bacterium]|nr:sigma-70 family RNA polymerase sigma factor [Anaerolineae bacterium]